MVQVPGEGPGGGGLGGVIVAGKFLPIPPSLPIFSFLCPPPPTWPFVQGIPPETPSPDSLLVNGRCRVGLHVTADPGTGKHARSDRSDGPWNGVMLEVLEGGECVVQRRGLERGRKSTFEGWMVQPNLSWAKVVESGGSTDYQRMSRRSQARVNEDGSSG